jgi:hypothetical protein
MRRKGARKHFARRLNVKTSKSRLLPLNSRISPSGSRGPLSQTYNRTAQGILSDVTVSYTPVIFYFQYLGSVIVIT